MSQKWTPDTSLSELIFPLQLPIPNRFPTPGAGFHEQHSLKPIFFQIFPKRALMWHFIWKFSGKTTPHRIDGTSQEFPQQQHPSNLPFFTPRMQIVSLFPPLFSLFCP